MENNFLFYWSILLVAIIPFNHISFKQFLIQLCNSFTYAVFFCRKFSFCKRLRRVFLFRLRLFPPNIIIDVPFFIAYQSLCELFNFAAFPSQMEARSNKVYYYVKSCSSQIFRYQFSQTDYHVKTINNQLCHDNYTEHL